MLTVADRTGCCRSPEKSSHPNCRGQGSFTEKLTHHPIRHLPDKWRTKEGALVGQVCTGYLSGRGEEDAERGKRSMERVT